MDTDLGEKGKKSGPASQTAPQGLPGPYTYEPGDDVDPATDYENVLTD